MEYWENENNELSAQLPEESAQQGIIQRVEETELEETSEAQMEPVPGEEEEHIFVKTSPFADSPYEMHVPVQQRVIVKHKRRKSAGVWKRIISAVLVIVLVAAASFSTAAVLNRRWEAKMAVQSKQMQDYIAALEKKVEENKTTDTVVVMKPGEGVEGKSPAQIYEENVNAVVAVTCNVPSDGLYGSSDSFGSGFIISADGYVVTNYHVVQGGVKISVIMADGAEYIAQLIGYDEINDIALLKADTENLPHVTIGSSTSMLVGERVVAIGNPLGELTSTLTVGYLSAKDRLIATDGSGINMLQTDAAINSGNSGGPLFNAQGEVIGITTAKYSGTTTSGASIEGISFAIPIDDVIGMLSDLREYGYVKTAYMGVMVRDVSADVANDYGLPLGAYVDEVTAGAAADRAGVCAKDIIVALGDQKVTSIAELTRVLRSYDAGDTTTITVFRSGNELVLEITFDERPQG